MPLWTKVVLAVASLAALLLALDRLALWMESRGWIYWRKMKPNGGAIAGLTAMQQFIQPEVRHVIEERDQRHTEDKSRSAAPPGTATSGGLVDPPPSR